MAISGAAANPWTGSGGVGVTRNPLVGMLMALMNLRLGFWLPNPNDDRRSRLRRSCKKSFRANHFDPGLKEVLGVSLREKSPVCLLSDGGHFENLGAVRADPPPAPSDRAVRRHRGPRLRLRRPAECLGAHRGRLRRPDRVRQGDDAAALHAVDRRHLPERRPPVRVRLRHRRRSSMRTAAPDISSISRPRCAKACASSSWATRARIGTFPTSRPPTSSSTRSSSRPTASWATSSRTNFIRHDMQNGGMLGQSIRTRRYPQAAE